MLYADMDFKFKKVGVIGLGKSGLAAAQLLKNKGISAEVSDCLNSQEVKERAELLKEQGIRVEIGGHTPEFIEDKDLLVVSPGVDNSFISLWAKKRNIPLISEIELGYSFCLRPIIAITGTNGKTSTAVLIGNLLKKAGKKVVVCGNIGTPFSQIVLKSNYEIVVLEVSSFQLEKIDKFKPYISVILNITPDHLDRYKTFEKYKQAKYRIFENQDASDWAVMPRSTLHAPRSRLEKNLPQILYLDEKNENEQAVRLVGEILGIEKRVIKSALKSFKGLEHRLEYVALIRGVAFINDSKATNVDSVRYALEETLPFVVLILGGRDKGGDFSMLNSLVKKKVKQIILIGEAKGKIKKELRGTKAIKEADSLQEAFDFACRAAKKGDAVLLSPGCASFDMFADFKQRGKEFKRMVEKIRG